MKQMVLRSYQLARSGKCATMGDIETCLRAEGFHPASIGEDLGMPVLRADLEKLCKEASGNQFENSPLRHRPRPQ